MRFRTCVDRSAAHAKPRNSAVAERAQRIDRGQEPISTALQLLPFHDAVDGWYPSGDV